TNRDSTSTTTYPDGTTITTTASPDPRFGMDAQVSSIATKAPSGLTQTVSETRTATMAAAADPITLKTYVDQVSLNGKLYKTSHDSTAKTITQTTPVGRQVVTTLDASGRVVQVQPPGVLPVTVH